MKDDTVVAFRQPGSFSDDPLTDILRAGARQLLAQAVEVEVEVHIVAHADLTDAEGRRRVVRHGYLPEREIQTGIGAVRLKAPRVRDRDPEAPGGRIGFSSSILPRYANWTPDRIRRDAAANGPHTEILIDVILRSKPHPEQGFRSCIGILRLAKTHGGERLEAACERALEIGARSYSSVASILKNNLDRRTPQQATDGPAIDHPNIRGPQYFH